MRAAQGVKAGAASDPASWVDRHGDALFRYALLRVRDAGLAEDLVQECFLAALDARTRFAGQSSERTWLIGILKRKVIDHLRRAAQEHRLESLDPAGGAEEAFFDRRGHWTSAPSRWAGDPRKRMETREFWDVFQRCLVGLSQHLADAFLLRELDQLSSEEVCKVLNLSPTNLWARLHRARLGLRRCLEAHGFAGTTQRDRD